ncbi:enolase C-terminal domain-like protein [Cyanobium sp. NS01]|uniref:enolase C-terminal domain-like protein n=1 Tax=Cyanobium sp. NS01 TaxID=261284 RepID=UPI0016487FF2|nr:enolase C-terminal domain-like protein [Cyanobium sp. NS01]QNI69494.1 O-succinylbenzoate synthase [Cyanobium sp. NS01]
MAQPPLLGETSAAQVLSLEWRPFRAPLPRPLRTARGCIEVKQGWLLRLEAPRHGAVGWGEAALLEGDSRSLDQAIAALPPESDRAALEDLLARPGCPRCLAFALGAALAELDGLPEGRWLDAPAGAALLPAGEAALAELERLLAEGSCPDPLVLKWKVAAEPDQLERRLLEQLLERLPASARLRLDANGGWTRATAWTWAERLRQEPRLEWLEQPLPPADREGLELLVRQLPVALDESLECHPELAGYWPSWQVRRPSQEGDPRPLLAALERGSSFLMLSSGFETGIGRRWLEHLAALQWRGPTPVAPGLARAWQPLGSLGSTSPEAVWRAAL